MCSFISLLAEFLFYLLIFMNADTFLLRVRICRSFFNIALLLIIIIKTDSLNNILHKFTNVTIFYTPLIMYMFDDSASENKPQ